jgi:hypothetical protein
MGGQKWALVSRVLDFILQQPTSKQETPKEPIKRKVKKKRTVQVEQLRLC